MMNKQGKGAGRLMDLENFKDDVNSGIADHEELIKRHSTVSVMHPQVTRQCSNANRPGKTMETFSS